MFFIPPKVRENLVEAGLCVADVELQTRAERIVIKAARVQKATVNRKRCPGAIPVDPLQGFI